MGPMKSKDTIEGSQDQLRAAFAAAGAGREVLLKYFGNLSKVSEKEKAGLVSEADVESERIIVEVLKKYFPDCQILGEESGLDQGRVKGKELSDMLWIIDPLDGTTNYVYEFPIFCISIGLHIKGRPALGVIDVPMLNARYHAVRGGGAFLNGMPISVSKRLEVKEALLATGFNLNIGGDVEKQVETFKKLLLRCRGVRRAGAAAYDLCLVAQGVFDAFWEKNLSPWDTAAGELLVREAGGIVTDYDGQDFSPDMKTILAGSPQLHKEILRIL